MVKIGKYFPKSEYDRRLKRVRKMMQSRNLDAILVSCPENVYYLCGLDHMGYFAYQMLVVPRDDTPILITRAMERATVQDQVPELRHVGYSDANIPETDVTAIPIDHLADALSDEDIVGSDPWMQPAGMPTRSVNAKKYDPYGSAPVRYTIKALKDSGLADKRLGMEMSSSFLSYSAAKGVVEGLDEADWQDCSGLVEDCRLKQSDRELTLTREAAAISDSMMLSAIAAAGNKVNQREIMAAIYDAMFRRGGTYPGFVPLVRSTGTLTHEHGTWNDVLLQSGDTLFLEMAGCIRRYHAPMGRLVHIDRADDSSVEARKICEEALMAAAEAIKPGAIAGDVYHAWQAVLDRHGLAEYRRHHCGYATGIGYPPSWSGSGVPIGLRADSKMELDTGMVFHLMSWLLRSAKGDAFLSDTIVVTERGCEFLTKLSRADDIR